jgi:hypothetical protein
VAAFFKSYFTAKSEHKPAPTTDHFSEAHLTYIDAALGWPFYSKKAMTEIFEQFMPKWPPTGLSYPTRISGDLHSAVVAFTDTPELFGGEIRILAAVDFKDGKVVRWIDYWDGRSFGAETAAKMRTPPDKFPGNFDYEVASDGASARIKEVAQKLANAFAAGDAATADALFSPDAVYLDRARRVRILGKEAIGKYLGRVLATVPYECSRRRATRHRRHRPQRRRSDRAARHDLGQWRDERRRSAGARLAVGREVARSVARKTRTYVNFVIAGLDPAILAAGKQHGPPS